LFGARAERRGSAEIVRERVRAPLRRAMLLWRAVW
jgi:hypothetical protein